MDPTSPGGQLQVLTPPLVMRDPEIALVWHERTTRTPAHQWIPEELTAGCRDL